MAKNSLLIKLLIFAFTYATFCVMNMARELGIILKNDVSTTLKLSTLFAGFLDFTFLFGIGIGYCFFAYMGTKRKLGMALIVGIFTIFLTVIGIGLSYWNSVFGSAPVLFLLFLLHGFAQSTGWPILVGLVSEKFYGSKQIGLILGLWSTSSNIGNITAAQLINILRSKYNWARPFIVIGILNCVFGMFYWIYENCNSNSDKISYLSKDAHESASINQIDSENKTFKDIVTQHEVLFLELLFFGVKFVHYGLLFWIPYYLINVQQIEMKNVVGIVSCFEFMVIIGSPSLGLLSDKFSSRSFLLAICLLSSALGLIPFAIGMESLVGIYLLYSMIGCFIGSSNTIITSACCMDAITKYKIKNKETVIALVDCFGTMGAALAQLVLGFLVSIGWGVAFGFLAMVISTCSAALFWKSAKDKRLQKQELGDVKELELQSYRSNKVSEMKKH